MEGTEKTIVYAIAAACILGIIVVGALVLTTHTTEEGFSELYFKNPDKLPNLVKIGNKIDFAFTTVSHEKKQIAYDYRVTYDGHEIKSGSFTLEPAGSAQNATDRRTINASLVPNSSSLVKMADPVVNQLSMRYNAALGTISSQGSKFNQMNLITSPNGYSLISWGVNGTAKQIDVNIPGKFILPIRSQMNNISDNVGLLIFDPKQKEAYNASFRTIIPEGSQYILSTDGRNPSNLGYEIRRDDWNIVNDLGNIDILHKNSNTTYRYAFKKVSVIVSSMGSKIRGSGNAAKSAGNETPAGSEYEIYFWIIVKDDPDKVQNM